VWKCICSQHDSQNAFQFAPFADAGMLSPMNSSSQNSGNPLISKIHQLFSRNLALDALHTQDQSARNLVK
jgi:hypothetical protein